MAGIYIHIPFCKQACYYCDFHFSTSLKNKDALINAIILEIQQRKSAWNKHEFDTIYFGGGTPSIVDFQDIAKIIESIDKTYRLHKKAEITLEANPDDLNENKLREFKQIGINRLSIGIQSFFEEDLKKLNRSHNARQATTSILTAQDIGFNNISIDLIYGIPGLTDDKWQKNIQKVTDLKISHVSAYALTVEKKTVLAHQIDKKIFPPISDRQAAKQFEYLIQNLQKKEFLHYEISNFGKPEALSLHNANYWKNIPYLGLGPAAHSYKDGKRRWNISNNALYIKNLVSNLYFKEEILGKKEIYNELIMTGLRTMWGINLKKIKALDVDLQQFILKSAKKYIDQNLLFIEDDHLKAFPKAWFVIDGIISDLFWV